MKSLARLLLVPVLGFGLFYFGAPVRGAEAAGFTPRDAVELSARGGLPNVFARLRRGDPVTIAYLGGSITAQRGWREQSQAWLRGRYPAAKIAEIHAAIGGTGSDLGVFRVEEDVVAGRPDLVFVEFAVNDGSAPPVNIRRAMEGIVRKVWRVLPTTDICFIYTVTARDTAGLSRGKMKRSESVMEEIAERYGIPSVHFGVEIARMEREGLLVMRSDVAPVTRVAGEELDAAAELTRDSRGRIVFSKDGVHPYPETGHVLYTQILARSLEKIAPLGEAGPHSLGAPLLADNWERARRVPLDRAGLRIDGPAKRLDPAADAEARRFTARMPSLWRLEPGATLRFKFRGTRLSFYDLLGPDGAILELTVDGRSRRQVRFDGFSVQARLASLGVAEDMEDAVHEVGVTVLAEKPDKAAILGERNRADLERFPSKYEPTRWNVGAVLVVGEIVE